MRTYLGVEYWTEGNNKWFYDLIDTRFKTLKEVKFFIKDWYENEIN